jgi:hypothetical protein
VRLGRSSPQPEQPILVRVAQLPEPLVRSHEGFQVAASPLARHERLRLHLQDAQQPLSHLEIRLIAGLVERDQDLVCQPSRKESAPFRLSLAPILAR